MKVKNIKLNNAGTVNKNEVMIETESGTITLYFSYQTIIAFYKNGDTVCRQNDWSTTTGKYLNEIEPDHKARVSGEEFEKKLAELFKD